MIDLHCHLLPSIDDGSRSVEQSLEVLRQFAADGVEHVVLTPHLKASRIERYGEDMVGRRATSFLALQEHAGDRPRLHLGFEILLDQPFPAIAAGDRRFALAGSRYYLVEFPLMIVDAFTTPALRQIAEAGVVPLVAHIERYAACTPDLVAAWREVGARTQVDATTLTRPTPRGGFARQLVGLGLVDVVAADNHGDSRTMRTAREYLEQHGHGEAARRLTEVNPRAVIDDSEMVDVPAAEMRDTFIRRLKRMFG
jgi:protein-tyrosine phosphatase